MSSAVAMLMTGGTVLLVLVVETLVEDVVVRMRARRSI